MFERDIVTTLQKRLSEPRKFIQIVVGPRQTGKSTAVYQALEKIKSPIVQFSFDRLRSPLKAVWRNHSKEDMRKSNQPNGRFLNAVKRLGIH